MYGDRIMKKMRRNHLLPALLCAALLIGAALAPQALAAEAAGDTTGTTQAEEQTADTASAAEAATSSEIHTYNLASEDWNGLLAGEETDSEGGGLYVGDRSTDGGISKMLIIAIIAFALGGIGVLFFIYSQFIYKAKLRRKAQEDALKDQERRERRQEIEERLHLKKPEEPAEAEAAPAEETPAEPEKTETPETKSQVLTKEDEQKLNEVDWDAFFDKNEKNDSNDK